MSWCRKPLTLIAVVFLAFGLIAAKKEEAGKKPAKEEPKKGKKKDAAEAKAAEDDKGAPKMSVPVPPGHDAKGLVIPLRNESGDLQMRFTMEVGKRTDLEHMDMTKLLIETFDEEGNAEMTINLPQSVLNLTSKVITTESGVVIKRSDFEIAGKTMEFNTETKAGRLGGKVRMLIYNLDNETNTQPGKPADAK